MYVTEAEVMSFAELREPEIRGVIIHRQPIPLDEQAVGIYPLTPYTFPFSILLSFKCFQQVYHESRELHITLRLLCFSDICVCTLSGSVITCSADTYYTIVPVYILPFQSEELPSTESAVNCQSEERPVLCRSRLKKLQELPDLIKGIDLLFSPFGT